MRTTLEETFSRRAADADRPDLDLGALVALGEQRLRRRRRGSVAVGAAGAAVALALVVSSGALTGSERQHDPLTPPADTPTPTAPAAPAARALVYRDMVRTDGAGEIHLGDELVGDEGGHVAGHLDVTADGVVLSTENGDVWFSDGARQVLIGSHVCGRNWSGVVGFYEQNSVITANAGSLVAWFECSPTPRGTLVVYDTATRTELVREQVRGCTGAGVHPQSCSLTAVVGEHVYFEDPNESVFDVETGVASEVSGSSYADEVRSRPRGLVVGESWATGDATDGTGQHFSRVGARLVPASGAAFDTATRAAVRLRLPTGYDPAPAADFTLFEWLDDDTVALVRGAAWETGEILTCRLSDGGCAVTADAPSADEVRIVPRQVLPG